MWRDGGSVMVSERWTRGAGCASLARSLGGPTMADAADLTATEALRAMAAGTLTPEGLLEACLARVAAREPVVRAMAFIDPAAVRAEKPAAGALHGVPIGVKDVLDTADMPTEYNSPVWPGIGRGRMRRRWLGRGRRGGGAWGRR